MENNQTETAREKEHLQKIIAIAREQIAQAKQAIEEKQSGIMEAKREARENGNYHIGNLYSSDEFEALIELNYYMSAVNDLVENCEEEKQNILRLEKLIKAPYFARIDFCFDGEDEVEQIYIGRTALTERISKQIHVYDWRSPIAGVFYRFMTGRAFYDAPAGRIEGDVRLKRQYEIQNSVLEYFFDTDRNINDEFLRQMLSKNTSPQMKSIVETIQREQDIVIRDMESDLLMVQGVAGSGKTSIALHRAAYLMYQGLQAKLSAGNILIVSPNSDFEDYIANVLPELGEENITSIVFEDVLKKILREKRIQPRREFLERAVTNGRHKSRIKNSMEYKTSEAFLEKLNQFLEQIPLQHIDFQNISYKGKEIISGKQLQKWVLRRPEVPLGIRLHQLEDYVLELIFGTVKRKDTAAERNLVRQELLQYTKPDLAELYLKTFEPGRLEADRLLYEDAIAIAYLTLKVYGTDKYREIKQVVIDEAQDYYPLQYEIFRLLFPNAKFTVLGDVNQTLAKQEDLSLYEKIPKLLNKNRSSLITLDKSFRCTNEILQFSLQFIEHRPEIQSFNRKGDTPQVVAAASREELLSLIEKEVEVCREKGYRTICLICKTEINTRRLERDLKAKMDMEGLFFMPVYLSKGLEFDAVIVCDADKQNYVDEDDKKLLYVECTRALHRLSLFGEG